MNLKDGVNASIALYKIETENIEKNTETNTSNKSELGHALPTLALGWCTVGRETGKR